MHRISKDGVLSCAAAVVINLIECSCEVKELSRVSLCCFLLLQFSKYSVQEKKKVARKRRSERNANMCLGTGKALRTNEPRFPNSRFSYKCLRIKHVLACC